MFRAGRLLNNRGMGLIQIVVAMGLLAIFINVLASTFSQMFRQMKYLDQKNDLMDIRSQILATVQNSDSCRCHINPTYSYFDSNVKAKLAFNTQLTKDQRKIDIPEMYSGCSPSLPKIVKVGDSTSSGMRVQEVSLSDLEPTGATNEWQGYWTVVMDPASMAGPMKNIRVPQRFIVDTTTSGNTPTHATVDSCMGTSTQMDCTSLGGTLNSTTGKCDFYMGQMARAIYRLNTVSGTVNVYVKDGPSTATAVKGVGCAPGSDSLYSTGPCVSPADGEPDPVTSPSQVFIYRNSYSMHGSSKKFDSIHCNGSYGWQLVGCFQAVDGTDSDIVYAANGCATGDYQQGSSVELTITCVKHLW